jgi:hypothetical protein
VLGRSLVPTQGHRRAERAGELRSGRRAGPRVASRRTVAVLNDERQGHVWMIGLEAVTDRPPDSRAISAIAAAAGAE